MPQWPKSTEKPAIPIGPPKKNSRSVEFRRRLAATWLLEEGSERPAMTEPSSLERSRVLGPNGWNVILRRRNTTNCWPNRRVPEIGFRVSDTLRFGQQFVVL